MWTPDAYEGAPTPVTAFMAVGVKLAAFAGFVRIFLVHLWPRQRALAEVLWVIAALTMTVGNVVALVQTNIKRMLAYSAIAHAGYLLVGMAAAPSPSRRRRDSLLPARLRIHESGRVRGGHRARTARRAARSRSADFRGLASRHPGLAAAMAIFMLSLTGVPPLAGFVGKFYIFSAALNARTTSGW